MAHQRMIATPEHPNGVLVPFTSEEEAQVLVDKKQWNDGAFDRAISNLREKRNQLLASSDWRDLPSYAGPKQAEWRVYRQSLRDMTSGLDTVEKVKAATFPTEPS
tara:strand:+ start:263 stop:577 length:315 start_codon:yes stop_codon:yes gene_type:complete